MKAGIIGAMEPEVAILKAKLANAITTEHAGYTFYQVNLMTVTLLLYSQVLVKWQRH